MEELDNSLDLFRSALPAWAPYANLLLYGIAGFLTGAIAAWVGGRIAIVPIRKLGRAGWTERARAAFPVIRVQCFTAMVPAAVIGFVSSTSYGPLAATPTELLIITTMVATYLGGFIARWQFMRKIKPDVGSTAKGLKNELIALLLFLPHGFVVIAMAFLLKPGFGWFGIGVIAIGVPSFIWFSCHGGVPILRLIGAAVPAPERVERIVSECGKRAGHLPKASWLIHWSMANAMAFPMTQQLGFTTTACGILSDDELAAIAHHELGHLCEPASVRYVRFLANFLILPFGFAGLIVGSWGWTGFGVMAVGCWAALHALRKLTCKMEARADAIGLLHEVNEGTYARALEKIYRNHLYPVVTGIKNPTHPDLYDRLVASGVEPSYPRPEPPGKKRSSTGILLALAITVLVAGALPYVPTLAFLALEDTEQQATWAVILTSGRHSMTTLAYERSNQGESDEAIAILRVATNYDSDDHHSPAYMATFLATYRRCDEALAALELAEERTHTAKQLEQCGWISQARESVESCEPGSATRDASMDEE